MRVASGHETEQSPSLRAGRESSGPCHTDGQCLPSGELGMSEPVAVLVLFAGALLGNIPLGFLRRRSPRWSVLWFVGCDGSVPILWLMRHGMDVESWVIILEILLALV